MLVSEQPALGAQVARNHLDRSERSLLEWTEVRVGFNAGVAVVVVVDGTSAAEVLINSGLGETVEAGDRCAEGCGIHVQLRCEFFDRVGADDNALLAQAFAPGQQCRRQVPPAVTDVEDQPRRNGRRLAIVVDHVVAEVDVAGGLIGVPGAGLVHDDSERHRPLRQHELRTALGRRHRGAPPGVVHHGECATRTHTNSDGGALVAGCG